MNRKKKIFTEVEAEEMKYLYEKECLSYNDIGKMYDCSRMTVDRYLRTTGCKIRSKEEGNKVSRIARLRTPDLIARKRAFIKIKAKYGKGVTRQTCASCTHAKTVSSVPVFDLTHSQKNGWKGVECANASSPYYSCLLNIDADGVPKPSITWGGCEQWEQAD